jgi:hypothetical protein
MTGDLENCGDRFNLIEAAVEAHVANAHRMLSALDASERTVLAQLLRKLLISFEA